LLIFLVIGLLSKFAFSQVSLRKIGEIETQIQGLSAAVQPANPTIPKNTPAGVRIVVSTASGQVSSADVASLLGGSIQVTGVLSGPGLNGAITLPVAASSGGTPIVDSLILPIPAINQAGDYVLSNLQIQVNGSPALDITPSTVPLKVIDQVLITSVQTRQLTLDEIKAAGVVLDSSDFTGFQFTIGLALESSATVISFPVVFDRQGIPIPSLLVPPLPPTRDSVPIPTIVPVMLNIVGLDGKLLLPHDITLPDGSPAPVKIPGVLVIPGNVGFLKQFFSAKLLVANGAPGGTGLVVHHVSAAINLPTGDDGVTGTTDDPLSLPNLQSGPEPAIKPVLGVGPDGQAGTADDVTTLNPADQGEAEFTIRGDKEGFHPISFNIQGTLEGLATGPVSVTGLAQGAVLVRNAFFDMTFAVPGVVRNGEQFKVFITVKNISQSAANLVTVSLDKARMSGVQLLSDPSQTINTIAAGGSQTLTYLFQSQRTGQVIASYLHFDTTDGTTGELKFTLGVGERGIPLSPDTLVLPASVANLPDSVVNAAMRVLGEGWSIANAPAGMLPASVIRTNKSVVTQKALALAEAGLRVQLGEALDATLRDLLDDFYGGQPLDPGFDQLLRSTDGGRDFERAVGAALAQPAAAIGVLDFQQKLSKVFASGPDSISFALTSGLSAPPVTFSLTDGNGNVSQSLGSSAQISTDVPGFAQVPLGAVDSSPLLGLLTAPKSFPYTLRLVASGAGTVDLAVAMPHADGNIIRGEIAGVMVSPGLQSRIVLDFSRPNRLVLEQDTNGDGTFATKQSLSTSIIAPLGPQFLTASVIDGATLQGASPMGVHMALLFDRAVDRTSAQQLANYQIPLNVVQHAQAQLSGRIVIANLQQPEGPNVPTSMTVSGIADLRGVVGPGGSQPAHSRLQDPGAVVSGRVFNADGTPVADAIITYSAFDPNDACISESPSAVSAVAVDGQGRYQIRYVHQDPCGRPFTVSTQDPNTGGLRQVNNFVRFGGEELIVDIALFGRGGVKGTVKDLTGKVVPGARVLVSSSTDFQIAAQTVTDGSGQYAVTGITVGPVSVQAASGNSLGHSAGTIPRAGSSVTVDVTLDSGAVNVSGTLMKSVDGGPLTPVPNWPVVYGLGPRPPSPPVTPLAIVNTNSSGNFVFNGVPEGNFAVFAQLTAADSGQATGFAIAGQTLPPQNITVAIDDKSRGTVNGKVFFPDGSAAGGVIVTGPIGGVLANSDGTYSLPGWPLSDGNQSVRALTRDGLQAGTATVLINLSGQVLNGINITLSGKGSAQFTVLDANGKPVAGQAVALTGGCSATCGCNPVKIQVQPDGSVKVSADPVLTGADGVATFTDLPVGAVSAKAVSAAFDVADGTASIPANNATGFAILRFHGSGAVTGTVADPDGRPSFGANIALTANVFDQESCSLTQGVAQQIQTDTSGAFNFKAIRAGAVGVTASQTFFPTQVGAQGNLGAGQTVNFNLKLVNSISGVFSGTVFLPDGTTSAGAGVQVTANGPLPDVTVSTDANGHFQFAKIFPEGTYSVTLRDPVSGGVAQDNVFLRAGQDMNRNFRLKGKGTVTVRVVDGSNNPVANAFVKLTENTFPNNEQEGAIQAANQGMVTFQQVFEGQFSVVVSDNVGRGGRTASILSGPGATVNVTVQLSSTGTVKGHFRMPDNTTPIPFASVSLIAAGRQIGQVTTDGNTDPGSFKFTFVPAGPVTLQAQDPVTGRTGISAGTIDTDGQELVLDVLAQALGTVQGLVTSNGTPQPGANVEIFSGSYHAATSSDSGGVYLVSGVPEGHIVVNASMQDNFLLGSTSGMLAGEGTQLQLDVALRGSGAIQGQVVQADGVTVAPAVLVTVSVGGPGGGTESVTTDLSGNFVFSVVPEGSADLHASVLDGIDQGQTSVTVTASSTVLATVRLNGVGSITGHTRDGAGNAIAAHLVISGTGAFPYTFVLDTNSDGAFSFPRVLAGNFTASISVPSGSVTLFGSAFASVQPNANTDIDVPLQPTGSITGTVVRSDGSTPAAGANVTVQLPGGSIVVQVPTNGMISVSSIPLVSFAVDFSDPITRGLAFVKNLSLTSDGQNIDLGKIVLVVDTTPPMMQLIAPVDGTFINTAIPFVSVTASDDLSGVNEASVSVVIDHQQVASGALSLTSHFTFPDGLHSLTVSVADNLGNTASVSGTFGIDTTPPSAPLIGGLTDGQTRGGIVPLTLSSTDLGSGVATIQLFLDSGAQVTPLPLKAPFTFNLNTRLFRDGNHVLNAQAVDAVGNISAVTSVHLTILNNLNSATIAGRVFQFDGTTPAANVMVRLSLLFTFLTTTTGADGSYRFDAVSLGAYTVEALDNAGLVRAHAGVNLFTRGTVVTQNLVLVALGSVTGQVLNSESSPAANLSVSLQSKNKQLGLFLSTFTDNNGQYAIAGVPVGAFTVLAQNPASLFAGEALGNIAAEGDTETVNLTLLDNAIPLPTNRFDGNQNLFDIQRDGSVQQGSGVFRGNFADLSGGFFLDLIAGGTPLRFTGSDIGRVQQQGNEIAIQQTGLAGLDVTRKVFVPGDGYFARYLEILSNPTSAPITVDVRITSNYNDAGAPSRIFATSSGDVLLDVSDPANPDRWADLTAPYAFVFDGVGGAQRVGSATVNHVSNAGQAMFAWQNVTVPPGGKMAYMHFEIQTNNDGIAPTERLAQLPPEALAGLTPDEISEIQNFAVPADGLSILPPLPPLIGLVSGRALTTDGRPLSANVSFLSDNKIYPRSLSAQTFQTGFFSFSGVPVDSFTLFASNFRAGSIFVSGNFPTDQTSVNQDVVFSTGNVQGVVRRANGSLNTCVSQVEIIAPNGFSVTDSPVVGADGSYSSVGLAPGDYQISNLSSCLGIENRVVTATVVEGRTTTADLVLPALAIALQVTVLHTDGTPYAGAQVFLNGVLRATTDQNGLVLILKVSEGGFLLFARDGSTFAGIVTGSGSVLPSDDGQVVRATLTQVTAPSQINGTVFAGDGLTPIPNAPVQLIDTNSGAQMDATFSDNTGAYSFTNIFTQNPTFTVKAQRFGLTTQRAGSFTGPGDTETVNLTLAAGVVKGRAAYFDGKPVPFPNVFAIQTTTICPALQCTGSVFDVFFASSSTDAAGNFAIVGLTPADFTVTDYESSLTATEQGSVTDVSIPAFVNVTLPPSGTVRGTVFDVNGAPAFAFVSLTSNNLNSSLNTDTVNGQYEFNHVPVGSFDVSGATGTLSQDGQIVTLDINLLSPGTITGTVFKSDGVTAAPFARVTVGIVSTQASASGNYVLTLPSGPAVVTATDLAGNFAFGSAVVTTSGANVVNLTLMPGVDFSGGFNSLFDLTGADQFIYFIGCSGEVRNTFDWTLKINGVRFPCIKGAAQEMGGRELRMTATDDSGLNITRRIFVPAAGKFARYVEILSNPTTAAIAVGVEIDGEEGGANFDELPPLHVLTDPATNGNTLAITKQERACCVLSDVLQDGKGRVNVTGTHFVDNDNHVLYRWNDLVIPPGLTVSLMHFAVQRDAADQAGVQAQAEALVNLTDPDALAGLSAADLARILNFNIATVGSVPGTANVQVTVLGSTGSGLGGAEVVLQNAGGSVFAGPTAADGTATIFNVAPGGFQVTAFKNGFAGSVAGNIQPGDAGTTVAVTIAAPFSGAVQGTVFAGDGTTPVVGAEVELFDVVSGELIATTGTDPAGFYQFANVAAGAQGFTVRAFSHAAPNIVAQQTTGLTGNGGTTIVNLILPLSVIRGTVFFFDGTTPVPGPNVFLTTEASGNVQTFFANSTDANGNYTVLGIPAGEFLMIAQDGASGLQTTVTLSLPNITMPATFNLRLPAAGMVHGTVTGSAGAPIASAQVTIADAGNAFVNTTFTDDQGAYQFANIAIGEFLLRATSFSGDASLLGALTENNQVGTSDVRFPGSGTVTGRVFQSDGITPTAFARVVAQSGFSQFSGFTDNVGHYQINGVQAGDLQVSSGSAVAEGALASGQSVTVNLVAGNSGGSFTFLTGADGFGYTAGPNGSLGGGSSDEGFTFQSPFSADTLTIATDPSAFPSFQTSRTEIVGRQLVVGPVDIDTLKITRKVFVPTSGGFARVLDVIKNIGTAPLTFDAGQQTQASGRATINASAGSDTSFVVEPDGSFCSTCRLPNFAEVMAGPGAARPVSNLQVQRGAGLIVYQWNRVTVPAGSTVIFMHFVVQGNPSDLAGLQFQVQSLENLTDPNALFGMSTQEKAEVVNFSSPSLIAMNLRKRELKVSSPVGTLWSSASWPGRFPDKNACLLVQIYWPSVRTFQGLIANVQSFHGYAWPLALHSEVAVRNDVTEKAVREHEPNRRTDAMIENECCVFQSIDGGQR